MITYLLPTLAIGTIDDDYHSFEAIVNLSSIFHYQLHGGKIEPDRHCFVIHEEPRLLSVNWVDAREPKYFDYLGNGVWVVERILDFLDRTADQSRLIMCDKGISRSPSIALTYIYKRFVKDFDRDFLEIEALFRGNYFYEYQPGRGIEQFLMTHWQEIE